MFDAVQERVRTNRRTGEIPEPHDDVASDSAPEVVGPVTGTDPMTLGPASDADVERERVQGVAPLTEEDLFILRSPVSNVLKGRFQAEYLEDWRRAGATDMLFRQAGAFKLDDEIPPDVGIGYNALVPKGPFVEGSNWLEMPTWELAVGIEQRLALAFEAHLREATADRLGETVAVDASAIVNAATSMADDLRGTGYHPSAIVIAGRPSTDIAVAVADLITPDWMLDGILSTTFHVLGMHQNLPVFEMDHPGPPALYVVDLARFGTLHRYGEQPEFALDQIDEETATAWLQREPSIVPDVPAKPEFEHERIQQLMLRAHLQLYERYELRIKDPRAAVCRPLAGL